MFLFNTFCADFFARTVAVVRFFFFKQKTAYEITRGLEFRRVLFRSADDDVCSTILGRSLGSRQFLGTDKARGLYDLDRQAVEAFGEGFGVLA